MLPVNQQDNKANLVGVFKQGFSEGRIKANEDVALQSLRQDFEAL